MADYIYVVVQPFGPHQTGAHVPLHEIGEENMHRVVRVHAQPTEPPPDAFAEQPAEEPS